MALHDHALMGDAGVSDEGVFQSRRSCSKESLKISKCVCHRSSMPQGGGG